MSRLERAAFSVFLGLLWAWMIVLESDLPGDAAAQALLDIAIAVASVGTWYGVLVLLERLTNGHHSAEIRDSRGQRRRGQR